MNANLYTLLDAFRYDLLKVSLPSFGPELAICATIVLMLLVRMPGFGRKVNSFWIALPGCLIALWLAAPWAHLDAGYMKAHDVAGQAGKQIFDGLLIYDGLTVYFRTILLVFAVLFLVFTKLSGIPDREDSPDFYTLVLGGLLGMCVMASANHLLTVFLGVEMASVPSYALAGILKGRRKSGEAAIKYAVYGAGAAGVMLYGISLLAGALGTVHMPTMAAQLAALSPEAFADRRTVLILGSLMVTVGLAFKLSAVPFHFWAPDVFEGACAEVNAFLSVASKAAALALLIRVAIGLTHVPATHAPPVIAAVEQGHAQLEESLSTTQPFRLVSAADPHLPPAKSLTVQDPIAVNHSANLSAARKFAAGLVALLAAITCTFGNLAAYGQTNIKRLLAYSTIAHAGYMMMPIAAAITMSAKDPSGAEKAIGALAFYVATYVFMNLGAFAIVAFLRNAIRSEEIADYAGLIKRSPGLVICFSAILISLVGLPPLAGFPAKLLAFGALTNAEMYLLLLIGCINSAISLFYYIRVVKTMTIDPEPADRVPASFSMISPEGIYVALVTIPVVLLGVWWESLYGWAQAAAAQLL
ncbi:MAG: NADH-quinone oxidoreductase subunit N [Planctomycetia bacterium]|nr:NADH-quinone oxidoreductase subunit N [Planctomycetia bacterium]